MKIHYIYIWEEAHVNCSHMISRYISCAEVSKYGLHGPIMLRKHDNYSLSLRIRNETIRRIGKNEDELDT